MGRKAIQMAATAVLVALLSAALLPAAVMGQSADQQTWMTSITYYTPSEESGTLQISYYEEGTGTKTDVDPITLEPHRAGSLFIGNTSVSDGFSGSAVLSADVPIVATGVQVAPSPAGGFQYPRALYTGFDASAASEDFFIPTVLYHKFNTNSLVSIQNVENTDINATLTVYEQGQQTPVAEKTVPIPPGSSQVLAASELGVDKGFSGSVVITAGGKVVAAAQENDISGQGAKAFEGVTGGASTAYMASMMCDAFGGQTSYYAIQNASPRGGEVDIAFYDKAGELIHTVDDYYVPPRDKASINPCQYVPYEPVLQGITGSAVMYSHDGIDLVVVGKVSGGGMTPTAFVGQSQGSTRVAAPYVRWHHDPAQGERSYVAIMNAGLHAAKNVMAFYYDGQGHLAGVDDVATQSHPLKPFTKTNTDPRSAGALDDDGNFGVNPYGGAVEIHSDQPVVVVVRVARTASDGSGSVLAEDYNGTPLKGPSGTAKVAGPEGAPPEYVPMVFRAGP